MIPKNWSWSLVRTSEGTILHLTGRSTICRVVPPESMQDRAALEALKVEMAEEMSKFLLEQAREMVKAAGAREAKPQ